MDLTGVLRPGHAQLRVLDLEESIEFYSNVLGLIQTGRDGDRAYFKAWDERDHHSLILRGAGEAGIDFFGFKVADEATLNQLEKDLNAYGVKTQRVAAGDLLETGERVRFTAATGHVFELYAHKTEIGNGLGYVNPYSWNETAERGIAPIRMDHTLLYGPSIEENEKLFTEVLGFHVSERIMLPDLLRQALNEVMPQAQARNVTVAVAGIDDDMPAVYGSLHWLSKATLWLHCTALCHKRCVRIA